MNTKDCNCGATGWATYVTSCFFVMSFLFVGSVVVSFQVWNTNSKLRESILINAGKEKWAAKALGIEGETHAKQ